MEKSVSVSSDRNIQDHLWMSSTYFGRTDPIEICHSICDKPALLVLTYILREFGKGIRNGNSHSLSLARFDRKMSFHFPQVFSLTPCPHRQPKLSLYEPHMEHNMASNYKSLYEIFYKISPEVVKSGNVQ